MTPEEAEKPDAYADLARGIFEVKPGTSRKIGKAAALGMGYAGEAKRDQSRQRRENARLSALAEQLAASPEEAEKRREGWAKVKAILARWRAAKPLDTGPSGSADG